MHDRISVSSLNFPDLDAIGAVTALGDLGVGHTTAQGSVLEVFGWDKAITLYERSGIGVDALIAPYPKTLADRSTWPAMRRSIIDTVDAAAELKAGAVYTVTGPLIGDHDFSVATFLEFIEPARARAIECGIPLAIEPTLPLFAAVSFVTSLAQMDPLAQAGLDTCLDLYHLWDDPDLDDWLTERAARFPLCQVGDCIAEGDNRPKVVLGEGDIPLSDRIGSIAASGYTGVFDIELTPGERIAQTGYLSAVRQSISHLDQVLTSLGI
ncbi:MAG: TIM barrel protein [Gordonia sp. (in: high G+C Gram-positive bacteria)]